MGFKDGLAGARAIQEGADKKKQEETERAAAEKAKEEAAEKSRAETEVRRGELSKEREDVGAELANAETEADGAAEAIGEMETYIAEQGENLVPDAKAVIDANIAEAKAAMTKLDGLKAEIARIDGELATLDNGAAPEAAASAETSSEDEPDFVVEEMDDEVSPTTERTPVVAEVEAAEKPVVETTPEEAAEAPAENAETPKGLKVVEGAILRKTLDKLKEQNKEWPMSAYHELIQRMEDRTSGDTGVIAALDEAGIAELQGMRAELEVMIQKAEPGEDSAAKAARRLDAAIETGKKYIELRDPEALLKELDSGGFDSRKIMGKIHELLEMGEKAPALKKAVLEKIGTAPLDLIEETKEEAQRQENAFDAGRTAEQRAQSPKRIKSNFYTPGFKSLGRIAREMERSNPEVADKYTKFIFDGITERFGEAKPEEVRSGLFATADNEVAYAALNNVYERLAKGESMPDDVQDSLAKALAVFEKSDGVKDRADTSSRFLEDPWIERALWDVKKEDKPAALKKVKEGLQAIKNRTPK
jgi:hypothetical protein